jgi:hypothetical protein
MDGWPALAMHGDKTQPERDWVLAEFKSGRHPIMLATDVAARGLGALRCPMRSVANRVCLLALLRGRCCNICLRNSSSRRAPGRKRARRPRAHAVGAWPLWLRRADATTGGARGQSFPPPVLPPRVAALRAARKPWHPRSVVVPVPRWSNLAVAELHPPLLRGSARPCLRCCMCGSAADARSDTCIAPDEQQM